MTVQPRIGLEIHVRPVTKTKLFCTCEAGFGGRPNTRCCPRCLGLPGSMPKLNEQAVRQAVKAGLALGCEIPSKSVFVRKGYSYPDLPKGYQITQWEDPICRDGRVELSGKKIGIFRIQLEEDAGKMIHDRGACTLVDYNRCGLPLLEIVTAPELESPEQAAAFVKELIARLRKYGIAECRMEQGGLRMDVNVSLNGGERVEIKNINSIRCMGKALRYEIGRQRELLEQGGAVSYETRRYDERQEITVHMRSKEQSPDYRFFPEPDLPPLLLSREDIAAARRELDQTNHG